LLDSLLQEQVKDMAVLWLHEDSRVGLWQHEDSRRAGQLSFSLSKSVNQYEMRLGSEDDDMQDIEFEVADKLGIQGVVHAHKLILVLSSPVFKKQLNKSTKVLRIQGPSLSSFKGFLQLIYSGSAESLGSWAGLEDLLQIELLLEKYKVPHMAEKVRHLVEESRVSSRNMVHVAYLARKYHREEYLKKTCTKLLERCESVLQFGSQSSVQLSNLLLSILASSKACKNCGAEMCLDGRKVEMARTGTRVRASKQFRSAQGLRVQAGWAGVVKKFHTEKKKRRCKYFNNSFLTKIVVRWSSDAFHLFHPSTRNMLYKCS